MIAGGDVDKAERRHKVERGGPGVRGSVRPGHDGTDDGGVYVRRIRSDARNRIAELRAAFLDSVRHGLAVLEVAHGDAAWREAAFRLRGLAASFGAVRLMAIATEAAEAEAQDAALLRRLRRAVERL